MGGQAHHGVMDTFWFYALAAFIALCVGGGAFFGARAILTNPAVAMSYVRYFGGLLGTLLLRTFAEDFGPENTKKVQEETRRNKRRPPKWGHGGEK